VVLRIEMVPLAQKIAQGTLALVLLLLVLLHVLTDAALEELDPARSSLE
jgi:hypothetical protein